MFYHVFYHLKYSLHIHRFCFSCVTLILSRALDNEMEAEPVSVLGPCPVCCVVCVTWAETGRHMAWWVQVGVWSQPACLPSKPVSAPSGLCVLRRLPHVLYLNSSSVQCGAEKSSQLLNSEA